MECFPTDGRIEVAVSVGEERFKTDSGFVETEICDEAEECIRALGSVAGSITSVWRRTDCLCQLRKRNTAQYECARNKAAQPPQLLRYRDFRGYF